MKSVVEPPVAGAPRRERKPPDMLSFGLAGLVQRSLPARSVPSVLAEAARSLLTVGLRFTAARFEDDALTIEQTTEDDVLTERVESVLGQSLRGTRFELPEEWSARPLQRERRAVFALGLSSPVAAGLAQALERVLPPLRSALMAAGLNHAVVVPVHLKDRPWGLYVICGPSLRPEHLPAVSLYASTVTQSLERAVMRAELESQERSLQAVEKLHGLEAGTDARLFAQALCQVAADATKSDLAAVARVERGQSQLSMLGAAGRSFKNLDSFRRLNVGELSQEILRDARPKAYVARLSPSPLRGYLETLGVQALAVIPLVTRGQVRGLLYLARTTQSPYDAEELKLAELLAGQIGSRLENTRQLAAAGPLDGVGLLIELLRLGSEELERRALIDRALQTLVDALDIQLFVLHVVDGGALQYAGARGAPDVFLSPDQTFPHQEMDTTSFCGRVAVERRLMMGQADEAGVSAEMKAMGFVQRVGVPILHGGRLLGVLCGLRKHNGPFRMEEQHLLHLSAALFGLALDRLHHREGKDPPSEDLSLINELGGWVAQHQDAEAVIKVAIRQLQRICRSQYVSVFLHDKKAKVLRQAEKNPQAGGQIEIPVNAQSLTASVFHSRKPLIVNDLEQHPGVYRQLSERYKFRSVMLIPLVSQGEALGVAVLAEEHHRIFHPAELERAMAIGTQLAAALFSGQLYSALKESYDSLERAQKELVEHERLAALGELSAVVAHEVRNPLAVIFNSLESLKKLLKPSGDAAMLLDIVGEESDRLNRIVGDLLDFAKPHEAVLRLEPLEPVLRSAVEAALLTSVGRDAEVKVQVPPELPSAWIDSRLLRQALLNLIVNALQAVPRAAKVRVSAKSEGEDGVRIEISDNGPGIPPEVRERVFEPFFTTKAFGTGLGLAVVTRIVASLQAELTLETSAEKGTTFALRLRATEEEKSRSLTER